MQEQKVFNETNLKGFFSENYDKVMSKSKMAEQISDLESTEDETRKRKRK